MITSQRFLYLFFILLLTLIFFRFATIQNITEDKEDFYFYTQECGELLSVVKDSDKAEVHVYNTDVVEWHKDNNRTSFLPYDFVTFRFAKDKNATYQVMPNTEDELSFDVRGRRFEILGGDTLLYLKQKIKPLMRFAENDTARFVILSSNNKWINYKTKGLKIASFEEGYYVYDNGIEIPIPYFKGNTNKLVNYTNNIYTKNKPDEKKLKTVTLTSSSSIRHKKREGEVIKIDLKSKKIKINYFTGINKLKEFKLLNASSGLYVDRNSTKDRYIAKYLSVPYTIPLKEQTIHLKCVDETFNSGSYFLNALFPYKVPIVDKPQIGYSKKPLKQELDTLIKFDTLEGLYIDDIDAEVNYYTADNSTPLPAVVDYSKVLPLYLNDDTIKGQFVAPPYTINKEFFYTVKTKKAKISLLFYGNIEVVQGNKIIYKENTRNFSSKWEKLRTISLKGGEEKLLTIKVFPEKFTNQNIFVSKQRLDVRYRYSKGKGVFPTVSDSKCIVTYKDHLYYYAIKEKEKIGSIYKIEFDVLNKKNNISLTSLHDLKKYIYRNKFWNYKNTKLNTIDIKYKISFSSIKRVRKDGEVLSIYDKDNFREIIPRPYINGYKTKHKLLEKQDLVNFEKLLPIYGDGIRFGLLSKGLKEEDLTLDKNFSMQIAEIFEEVIVDKKIKSKYKKALEKHDEIIEGAVIVLKVSGDKSSVVGMFSYPYPKGILTNQYSSNIRKELIVDKYNKNKSRIYNRALEMTGPPGSTFKIVTALSAFKEGYLTPDNTNINLLTNKRTLEGTPFKNSLIEGFGLKNYKSKPTLHPNFYEAFKHSYNTYFSYLGMLMYKPLENEYKESLYPVYYSKEKRKKEFSLINTAEKLMFNQRIQLSKKHHIYSSVSTFPTQYIYTKQIADVSIGQFDIRATPLQMAVVASTIKTGKVISPSIVKKEKSVVVDDEYFMSFNDPLNLKEITKSKDLTLKSNRTFTEKIFNLVKSKDNMESIKVAMALVAHSGGSADSAFEEFDFSKIEVYSKTGTATKSEEKTDVELYDGWFVAFTENKDETKRDNDIVVVTVVKNSGLGGAVSAPITRKVIEAWYKSVENAK